MYSRILIAGILAAGLALSGAQAQNTPAPGGILEGDWAKMPIGSYVMIGGVIFVVVAGGLVLLDDDDNKPSTTPPPTPPSSSTTTTTS